MQSRLLILLLIFSWFLIAASDNTDNVDNVKECIQQCFGVKNDKTYGFLNLQVTRPSAAKWCQLKNDQRTHPTKNVKDKSRDPHSVDIQDYYTYVNLLTNYFVFLSCASSALFFFYFLLETVLA
jgi:hypothetical protein